MNPTRAEKLRLDKFLNGEWGAPLTRLTKKEQRSVLDLLEDRNKSRNRIADAEKLTKRLTEERLERRRLAPMPRKQLQTKLARRLVKMWGDEERPERFEDPRKTTFRVVFANLGPMPTEIMRDFMAMNDRDFENFSRRYVLDDPQYQHPMYPAEEWNPLWYHTSIYW